MQSESETDNDTRDMCEDRGVQRALEFELEPEENVFEVQLQDVEREEVRRYPDRVRQPPAWLLEYDM